MLAERLSDIIKYAIYETKLSLADPYNGDYTKEIYSQFDIIWMYQHSFIYFFAYLLDNLKILAKRFMSKFAQLRKHNLKQLQTILNQCIIGDC